MTWLATVCRRALRPLLALLVLTPTLVLAQAVAPRIAEGGEANLVVPDLSQVQFLGISGRALVDAVIDKTGKVRDAHTVRSAPALDRAARG